MVMVVVMRSQRQRSHVLQQLSPSLSSSLRLPSVTFLESKLLVLGFLLSESKQMIQETEIHGRIAIPSKSLDRNGAIPLSSVVACLLKELLLIKSTEEHGYFLGITKLKSIGSGELEEKSNEILFPVAFYCRTFLPVVGEIMLGVVHKIHSRGVFLRCGPMKYIYLSAQKMPNFYYVRTKTREIFMSDDLSRIEEDVVIRFMVFAMRWRKKHWDTDIEREFMILGCLEGDCLGPVSLSGSDELSL